MLGVFIRTNKLHLKYHEACYIKLSYKKQILGENYVHIDELHNNWDYNDYMRIIMYEDMLHRHTT